MASNGFTNDELLQNSLKIREAARELLDAQINEALKEANEMPESDEKKLIRIMTKTPSERTAAEYLFLIGEVCKHAKNCEDLECPWTTTCWRMKGLNYHVKLLKKVNKATPSALVQLWDRQVDLEMILDDAHQYSCPPSDCTCRIIEHYRYFLMECVRKVKEEKNHPPTAGDSTRVSLNLQPVMDHFAGHMEFRYRVAGDSLYDKLQVKKGAFNLYQTLYLKGVEDGARMLEESMAAREEEEKKKNDISQETLTAAAKYFKERIGELTSPASMMGIAKGLTDEQRSRLRARVAANPRPESEDPAVQRATRNGMMPKADKELNKNPDCLHDTKTCNCTIGDVIVDLEIGLKKKIRLNEGFERKPSAAILKELRRRVTLLVFCRGVDLGGNFRPLVRVVTCMINGEPWKVVYNGDPHNFFNDTQFDMAMTHYYFAGRYHYNAQVIMYNFLEQAYSEGKDRFEALLKDAGGKHTVLFNMAYSRPCEAKENADKLKHGIRPILPKLISRGETVWFSGTFVKGVAGRIFHLWKGTIESDRKKFELIISHLGAKIPTPAANPPSNSLGPYPTSQNHPSASKNGPSRSQNPPSTSQEQEELSDDEDLDQPCTSNTEWRDPRQNSEWDDTEEWSGEVISMEQLDKCGARFSEHERSVFKKYNKPVENWASKLLRRVNKNEIAKAFLLSKLETEKAKICVKLGCLPVNKRKEVIVPDELVLMCYAERRERTNGPLGELLFPTSQEAFEKTFSDIVSSSSSSSSTVSTAPSQEMEKVFPRVGQAALLSFSNKPPRALAENASEPEADDKSDDSTASQYAVWALEEVLPGGKKRGPGGKAPARRLVMTKVKNNQVVKVEKLPSPSSSSTEETTSSSEEDRVPSPTPATRHLYAIPSKEGGFWEHRKRSKERKQKMKAEIKAKIKAEKRSTRNSGSSSK